MKQVNKFEMEMAPTIMHQTEKEFTVFCLNLRFGLADDGANNWNHRKHAYPRLLEKHPADFYAFQEANDFQTTYLKEILPDHSVIGQRSPAPKAWQNNVIFYHRKWKCQSSEHFYLSDTPGVPSKFEESQWPRQCTIGTFQKDNVCVMVINTHFDFKADVQRKSAVLIIDRIKRLSARHPAILMGDLNAGPGSGCIAALTQSVNEFKSAMAPDQMGTYHGFEGKAKGEPIDWILYRGDIHKKHSTIITSPVDGIYPSDHFPLTARFIPKV